MQLSRNPPDDFGLDRRGLFGAEFVTTSPKILGGRGIGYPDIDAKHPGTTALGAARYKIFNVRTRVGSAGVGQARLAEAARSENPRPYRERSATRSLVNAHKRLSWSASPVKLRNGATATGDARQQAGHGAAARSAVGGPNAPPSRRVA